MNSATVHLLWRCWLDNGGVLTLPYREGMLPPSAEASSGPNVHPQWECHPTRKLFCCTVHKVAPLLFENLTWSWVAVITWASNITTCCFVLLVYFLHRLLQVRPWYPRPRACCGVVRIDPLHFLAGCRKRQLNRALSVCLSALVLVCVLVCCLLEPLFVYH